MAPRRRDRRPAAQGEELEVEVERLVNGPGAMARGPDGRVVFVDEGFPGSASERSWRASDAGIGGRGSFGPSILRRPSGGPRGAA